MQSTKLFSLQLAFVLALSCAPAYAEDGHGHADNHGDEHGDTHGDAHGDSHGHGHSEHGEDSEPTKGIHGGRLLKEGALALELTIFEKDVPPQFRIYPFLEQKPVKPADVTISVELTRFGGRKEVFTLLPVADYLTSEKSVEEPHSFEVKVTATYAGKNYLWEYESHEGRTELSAEALKIANITTELAGPQAIANLTHVYGRLLTNQDRVAHIRPRFPGVVREITKELGERVEKGDVLAVVESNQSLQPYEIRSQVTGELIARHATVGEFVSDDRELFIVADLSQVWADFQVYRDDFDEIEKGQQIKVDLGGEKQIEATVRYVAPVTDEATQSKLVRAVLPNKDGKLRPGLFVSGTLVSNQTPVTLAIRREAIQSFRDWKVVYLTDGHTFQAVPVELGRRDSQYVEVLSGLSPGDRYVARNSFIIKADIEKSGASHDH